MGNYSLHNYKGGKRLFPKNEWLTEEYLEEHEPFFMTEQFVKDGFKTYSRFRFRTCEPMRFTDTLEYDLECPRCRGTLRLCDMPRDVKTHGLYKCRRCDDEMNKGEAFE